MSAAIYARKSTDIDGGDVDDLAMKALLNHYDGRPVVVNTRLGWGIHGEDPPRLCRLVVGID